MNTSLVINFTNYKNVINNFCFLIKKKYASSSSSSSIWVYIFQIVDSISI